MVMGALRGGGVHEKKSGGCVVKDLGHACTMVGACMAGGHNMGGMRGRGMHGRGHAWQGACMDQILRDTCQ